VGTRLAVGPEDGLGVGLRVGLGDGLGDRLGDGLGVGLGEGLGDALGERLGVESGGVGSDAGLEADGRSAICSVSCSTRASGRCAGTGPSSVAADNGGSRSGRAGCLRNRCRDHFGHGLGGLDARRGILHGGPNGATRGRQVYFRDTAGARDGHEGGHGKRQQGRMGN
jgi:hypothetical protein